MSAYDRPAKQPIVSSEVLLTTPVFDVVEECVRFGAAAEELTRDFIDHPGAVAVLAVDDQDRVLLISQYRHPVRMNLWEIPAGLLDLGGEQMLEAAQREFAEEADLKAAEWHTLVDFYTSPGANNEAIRIYLAEGLSEVPEAERHQREAEEAEITCEWVPLAEAVQAVLGGQIHNPSALAGLLALYAVRTGAGQLRDARASWPDQPRGIAP